MNASLRFVTTMFRTGALAALAFLLNACCSTSETDRVMTHPTPVPGHMHTLADDLAPCALCDIYDERHAAVVRVRQGGGVGAGFVIDDRGVIVTNAHVVGSAVTVFVETASGTLAPAAVVRQDPEIDLAILRTDVTDVRWASLDWRDRGSERVGGDIYVIGHPLGLGWTVTQGVISSRRRPGEAGAPSSLLQTDAAISPGNSGGPVFDARGRLIGVVRSKIVAPGAENIGFAIPWQDLRDFIEAEPLIVGSAAAAPAD